jgi:hypothetical protein
VPRCFGGLIVYVSGTVEGCALDDDIDGCEGLEERHEYAPETCWKWWGRCDRCGIVGAAA